MINGMRLSEINIEKESERIVLAAAKIIKAQIQEISYGIDFYPSNGDICDVYAACQWLPSMLQMFLQTTAKSTVKRAAIGQCLVRTARPRSVIPPLLFRLSVELDHIFWSKWLINQLSRLGYSISYDEVTRFKQNSIVLANFEYVLPKYPGSVTQLVADNVDPNICSLDGKNTFHGMGVIAVSTPFKQPQHTFQNSQIQRNKIMKVGIATANKGIPIKWFEESSEPGISAEKFKPLIELRFPYVVPLSTSCDLLWHSAQTVYTENQPQSS